MTQDLVFANAEILTLTPELPLARSVRLSGGRIVEVSATDLPGNGARVIDLAGATLTPGFNDAHAHSVWFGLSLHELSLDDAGSVEEVYDRVARCAHGLAADDWVVASGFNPMQLGNRYPERAGLDRAAAGRPVWIKQSSGHACVVNSRALELIAERSDLAAPIEGGLVVRDAQGEPTGLLEENAMRLVQQLHLPYSTRSLVQALDAATAQYLREGITSVTDAGIAGGWIGHSPIEFAAYQLARDEGVLRTRMQPMFSIDALGPLTAHPADGPVRALAGGIRTGLGDDWLRVGPVKIFSDGSLLGSTAAMTESYEGCPHNHGYLQSSEAELRAQAVEAARAGWSLAIHAIGDRAVDQAIELIGEAQRRFGRPRTPHRIEHGGVIRDDQLAALAAAGAAVVPQPYFIRAYGDGMIARLGAARAETSYRAASLLRAGITLPGSSDRPVAGGRPLDVMQAFAERLTETGRPFGAAERLTGLEALEAYTVGSARATGQSASKGRIAPGMLADLTVLTGRPDRVEPSEIGDIEVVMTVLDGRIVHGEA